MKERLQKYLARAGVASRRHAEELIAEGRVQVNNQKVTQMGTQVQVGTDLVTVDGELVSPQTTGYFLLYKPAGVVTTLDDPQGRPTIGAYLEDVAERVFPVGRLDYDAEGALIITNDGELAHKLTHPKFGVPRTYLAKVKGEPLPETLEKLRGGVRLEDGVATPKAVEVYEAAEKNTWLKITVAEGRPHLIKRLCAAVGHPVVRLYRPMYSGVTVQGLRPGQVRPLKEEEIELLQAVGNGELPPPEPEFALPPRRHGRNAPGFTEGMDEDGEELPVPVRKSSGGDRKAFTAKPSRLGKFGARKEKPAFGEKRERTGERGGRGGSFGEKRERSGGERGARGGGFGEKRERTGGFGDRGARGGGFGEKRERSGGDRGARGGGFGEKRERTGGFGDRGPRSGGFGEKRERTGGFGDRGARSGGFGEKRERTGGFGDRGPRSGGFGEKRERTGGFGDRGPRSGGFGEKRERTGGFGDRGPRSGGGFGEKRERTGGFGDRGARSGGFGEKRERTGGFGDRGARSSGGYGEKRERSGGFGDRGPRAGGERAGRGPGGSRGSGGAKPPKRGWNPSR